MSFSKRQLATLAGNVPIGTVLSYAGPTAPSGYLLCDGTAISRATYADLFSAIGTAYGVGDGSTTFNLPDLRGRVPVGKTTGGTFPTLGATGGAETHTLSTAQLPVHAHANTASADTAGNLISDPGHAHGAVHGNNLYRLQGTGGLGEIVSMRPDLYGANISSTSNGTGVSTVNHSHTVTMSNANAGSGNSHNNLQPYQVVNRIIRFASGATASSPVRNQVPSGTIDGGNATFTIANTPSANTQEVYLNGVRQRPGGGFDYTISGTTITFATAPPIGSTILVDYFVGG